MQKKLRERQIEKKIWKNLNREVEKCIVQERHYYNEKGMKKKKEEIWRKSKTRRKAELNRTGN